MKWIIFLSLLSLSSCIETGTDESQLFQEPPQLQEGEKITFEDLKALVLEPSRCTSCHFWAESEEGILDYIVPGEPFSSSLYLEIESGDMPLGGPTVTKDKLEYVESYIQALQK